MRQRFTITQKQYDTLLESMKPTPAIMLQITSGDSQQSRANNAWIKLGLELGFDGMTVEPTSDKFTITAEPIPNWVAPLIDSTPEYTAMCDWLGALVAKIQDTDTHPGYWDCECGKLNHINSTHEIYIHRKADTPYCYKCNTAHSDQPDARVSEVVKMLTSELEDCKTLTEAQS